MVLMACIVAIFLVLGAVSLYPGSGLTSAVTAVPRVDGLYFGSNGWVNFLLTNPSSRTASIRSVNAYETNCINATYLATVLVSANNVAPAGGTLSLTVQFQNLNWQSGVKYAFILVDSNGWKYPTTGLSGC